MKLAFDQENWKKNHKRAHFDFSQFVEWQNLFVECHNTQAYYMCPKYFLKIVGKSNNYRFYLANFLKFCENISHKLLRPSQFLEKIVEILELSALQK